MFSGVVVCKVGVGAWRGRGRVVLSSFDALCRIHGLAGGCGPACCAGSGSSCWPPGTLGPGCSESTPPSQFR